MTVRDSDTLKSYFNLTKVIIPANYVDLVDTIFAQSTSGEIGEHTHDDRYLQLSIANVVSAVHTFSPSTYGPPFILGEHAQGQTVAGLKADQLNRSINVSGLGLSGGGILTADRTISLASSSNPGASASILASTEAGALSLLRLNTDIIGDRSGSNLKLSPTGDIELDPSGNDVYPTTGYDLNLGTLSKKFLTLHAAELWVETLVAQDTIATIGGRILVAPTTVLTRDMAWSDETIYVKHNQIQYGDVVYLETSGKVEFMEVVSGATWTGSDYSYLVNRSIDGTGANQWYAGDTVLNTGQVGSGFIDLFSLDSINGMKLDYIFNYDYSLTTPSENLADSNAWTLFSVNGSFPELYDHVIFGVTSRTWQHLFFNIVVAGAFTANIYWYYWNGSSWTSFSPTLSSNFLKTTGLHYAIWNKDDLTGWTTLTWNNCPSYWILAQIGDGWTTAPVQGTRRVRSEKYHWGPSIVGNVRNSSTFNDWTEHWAVGNLNGVYGYGADTYGIGLGKYSASAEYMTIDPSNGIRMYSGGALRAQLDANVWTLGAVSDGEYVSISSSGISIFANAIETVKLDGSTGDATFGEVATSKFNLMWDASEGDLLLRLNTTAYFQVDGSAPLMKFGSDVSAAVTTALAVFGVDQTYNGEALGASDILIGDNSTGANNDKANILWDYSTGKLLFRGGTTMQVEIGTDGKLYAGGGAVVIDGDGISITADHFSYNKLKFKSGSTDLFSISADMYASGQYGGYIEMGSPSGATWLDFYLSTELGQKPYIKLSRNVGTGAGSIYIESDYVRSTGYIRSDTYLKAVGDSVSYGVFIGTDTQLYRTATDVLRTPDTFQVDGDLYTVTWTDYSGTSTIIGWSSFTFKNLSYKKVGKLMFVTFRLVGTSNSTSTSFTLPYSAANPLFTNLCRAQDNSGAYAVGIIGMVGGSSVATAYPTVAGGSWTVGNQKVIEGTLWYQTA